MLRAEIINEWPCRESKFVKFYVSKAPPPDYHGGRALNDVDNNLEARRSRKPAVA
jgi:hypothetical protein